MERIVYYGASDHTRQLITETVSRLPTEVQEFVFDRCRFVSIGCRMPAQVLPGRIGIHPTEKEAHNMWIIVLDEDLHPDNLYIDPDEPYGIVAHEVAHAWLGHDRLGEVPSDCEALAANLAKLWGFSGKGADAEHCTYPSGRPQLQP